MFKPLLAGLGLLDLVREAITPAPVDWTREQVRSVVLDEAGHFLTDFEWRYKQARDLYEEMAELGQGSAKVIDMGSRRQMTAEDINDLRHRLTGYTVTPQSPSAGQFAWAGLHIVYGGVDYTIVDGNSGATNKYFYFQKSVMAAPVSGSSSGAGNTLTGSVTKPILNGDDILVFINPVTGGGYTAGVPIIAASDAQGSLPAVVGNNSVDTAAIQALAVGSGNLAANSVIAGKINAGAVDNANQLANNVVATGAIQTGAVAPQKLNVLSHLLY